MVAAHVSVTDSSSVAADAATTRVGAGAVPAIELRNVTKSYGHVQAAAGVSFAVSAGEVVALVGDNGAGKSTLVSILSGVIELDEGEILLDGKAVRISSPQEAINLGIATVFQGLALVDQRSVAANLHLGRELRRLGFILRKGEMLEEAGAVLGRLGVDVPSVRARVGDLSGGQRQAVAVARAMLRGGRVMLMDEPTAALGVRESGRVLELIRRLRDEDHATLLVSHNIVNVFDVADRVVVLRHGRVVGDKKIAETSQEEVVRLIVSAEAL
jgi:D-xylose transport system ATP-binding protein